MEPKKNILILSPHLDDAILSCCDHIASWQKNNKVFIVTIFTRYGQEDSNLSVKNRLEESGFLSPQEQEKIRKLEDKAAMRKLKVDFLHLNFIDGGYRTSKGKAIYLGSSLFSGRIREDDKALIEKLQRKLKSFNKFESIVIPLGVGRHVDHVITREAAENVFDKKTIVYFVDYPYALIVSNWQLSLFNKLLISKKSVKRMSSQKEKLLKVYSSQYSLLFKEKPHYFEVTLT